MKSLNLQPAEPPVAGDGAMLDVVKIWHTFQGEGPFAGEPAVFVRLAGCNLLCPGCDTDYTRGRHHLSVGEIANEVMKYSPPMNEFKRMVVLTGGEPFRQPIGDLCRHLLESEYRLQIETNGSVYLDDFPYYSGNTWVVCSPKTATVKEELREKICCLKYVLDHEHVDPDDGLPTAVLGRTNRPARPWPGFHGQVFVQPADQGDPTKNTNNLHAAMWSCTRFGYRLSYQLHKILGVE